MSESISCRGKQHRIPGSSGFLNTTKQSIYKHFWSWISIRGWRADIWFGSANYAAGSFCCKRAIIRKAVCRRAGPARNALAGWRDKSQKSCTGAPAQPIPRQRPAPLAGCVSCAKRYFRYLTNILFLSRVLQTRYSKREGSEENSSGPDGLFARIWSIYQRHLSQKAPERAAWNKFKIVKRSAKNWFAKCFLHHYYLTIHKNWSPFFCYRQDKAIFLCYIK